MRHYLYVHHDTEGTNNQINANDARSDNFSRYPYARTDLSLLYCAVYAVEEIPRFLFFTTVKLWHTDGKRNSIHANLDVLSVSVSLFAKFQYVFKISIFTVYQYFAVLVDTMFKIWAQFYVRARHYSLLGSGRVCFN